jgi:Uma2 family endonuclease
MASLPHSKTVTYEEWLRMPEVKREEVVNGEISMMPPPLWSHCQILQDLYDLIRPQVNKDEVKVRVSAFDLIIRREPLTSRQPGLAVFRAAMIVERDGRIHSAPQLVVEVWSPANTPRERAEKLADYASLGVPEVWAFSPEDRAAEVLYLENGQFRRHALLTEGVLKPRHFPNVQVDIARVWPD